MRIGPNVSHGLAWGHLRPAAPRPSPVATPGDGTRQDADPLAGLGPAARGAWQGSVSAMRLTRATVSVLDRMETILGRMEDLAELGSDEALTDDQRAHLELRFEKLLGRLDRLSERPVLSSAGGEDGEGTSPSLGIDDGLSLDSTRGSLSVATAEDAAAALSTVAEALSILDAERAEVSRIQAHLTGALDALASLLEGTGTEEAPEADPAELATTQAAADPAAAVDAQAALDPAGVLAAVEG